MQKYTNADFSTRAGAYFIDMLLVSLPIGIIFAPSDSSSSQYPKISEALPIIILIQFVYFFLCTYFNKGQTLGQMIFKIRVIQCTQKTKKVRKNEFYPNIKKSAIHSLGKIIFILIIDLQIGYILYRNEPNKQKSTRFFQNLASTRVVVQKQS